MMMSHQRREVMRMIHHHYQSMQQADPAFCINKAQAAWPTCGSSPLAVTKPNMGEIWWLTPQSCSKTIIKQCWKIIKKCIRKIRRQSIAMQLQMIANNHKHFLCRGIFFFFFCWCPFHSFFMAFDLFFFMAICECLFLLPHFFKKFFLASFF